MRYKIKVYRNLIEFQEKNLIFVGAGTQLSYKNNGFLVVFKYADGSKTWCSGSLEDCTKNAKTSSLLFNSSISKCKECIKMRNNKFREEKLERILNDILL